MTLEQFARADDLVTKPEVEKVVRLAYFHFRRIQLKEFGIPEVNAWMNTLHLPQPNPSRLFSKLLASGACVKGQSNNLKLHARTISRLEAELPQLSEAAEDVASSGSILPTALTKDTRGYIERLAHQINASYEQNIFDGCAVLMRRLLEVLLIQTYEHHKIETQVQTAPDQYKDLKQIIAEATSNKTLALSKASKDVLDEFRVLGNFSAHKIIYNCRREEIKKIAREYRAAVEELLYKSGIKR